MAFGTRPAHESWMDARRGASRPRSGGGVPDAAGSLTDICSRMQAAYRRERLFSAYALCATGGRHILLEYSGAHRRFRDLAWSMGRELHSG